MAVGRCGLLLHLVLVLLLLLLLVLMLMLVLMLVLMLLLVLVVPCNLLVVSVEMLCTVMYLTI
jgi:hypothetical protein